MSTVSAQDILSTYKQTFLRGLATMLPTLLTLWVVWACWGFVSSSVAAPIANGLKTQLVSTQVGNRVVFYVWSNLSFLRKAEAAPAPAGLTSAELARFRRDEDERIALAEPGRRKDLREEIDARFPKWIGIVLAVIGCFLVGFFMASFLGRQLWKLVESFLIRVPLVKNIYPGAKQMVSFFLSGDDQRTLQAVVAVEFPRKGLWSIGFLTSENMPEIERASGEVVRGVYLGTPADGQVVMARESEIIAIDMTVDEALKFLMSGGVIGRDPDRPASAAVLPWASPEAPEGSSEEPAPPAADAQ